MSARAKLLAVVILAPWAAVPFASCGGSQPKPEEAPQEVEEPEAAPAAPPIALINSSVVIATCVDQSWMKRGAESAIRKLLEPCSKVPGGKSHFLATLRPGGRIELGAAEGDPADAVVPMCVVKNALRHKVFLKHPCTFDVKLEERPVEAPPAPPPAADGGV